MDIKFGTGGFRGVIGDDFIKENIKKIAQAICNLANENNLKKEIIIGYDYRFLSSETSKWIAEVFIANNFKVNLCSTATPSPAIMYYVNKHSLDIGVMITASHNPYIFHPQGSAWGNGSSYSAYCPLFLPLPRSQCQGACPLRHFPD